MPYTYNSINENTLILTKASKANKIQIKSINIK